MDDGWKRGEGVEGGGGGGRINLHQAPLREELMTDEQDPAEVGGVQSMHLPGLLQSSKKALCPVQQSMQFHSIDR